MTQLEKTLIVEDDALVEKILIVEDDAIILRFLSKTLESKRYSVTTARTGKDALEKIQTAYYNLVLLDIGLPDMLGTELLEKIRTSNRDTIVIMITGHPSLDSSIDSVNHGADGYLVKPVSKKDLVDIVERKIRERFEYLVDNIII
jgi:two-component system OmpR family response regulator